MVVVAAIAQAHVRGGGRGWKRRGLQGRCARCSIRAGRPQWLHAHTVHKHAHPHAAATQRRHCACSPFPRVLSPWKAAQAAHTQRSAAQRRQRLLLWEGPPAYPIPAPPLPAPCRPVTCCPGAPSEATWRAQGPRRPQSWRRQLRLRPRRRRGAAPSAPCAARPTPRGSSPVGGRARHITRCGVVPQAREAWNWLGGCRDPRCARVCWGIVRKAGARGPGGVRYICMHSRTHVLLLRRGRRGGSKGGRAPARTHARTCCCCWEDEGGSCPWDSMSSVVIWLCRS